MSQIDQFIFSNDFLEILMPFIHFNEVRDVKRFRGVCKRFAQMFLWCMYRGDQRCKTSVISTEYPQICLGWLERKPAVEHLSVHFSQPQGQSSDFEDYVKKIINLDVSQIRPLDQSPLYFNQERDWAGDRLNRRVISDPYRTEAVVQSITIGSALNLWDSDEFIAIISIIGRFEDWVNHTFDTTFGTGISHYLDYSGSCHASRGLCYMFTSEGIDMIGVYPHDHFMSFGIGDYYLLSTDTECCSNVKVPQKYTYFQSFMIPKLEPRGYTKIHKHSAFYSRYECSLDHNLIEIFPKQYGFRLTLFNRRGEPREIYIGFTRLCQLLYAETSTPVADAEPFVFEVSSDDADDHDGDNITISVPLVSSRLILSCSPIYDYENGGLTPRSFLVHVTVYKYRWASFPLLAQVESWNLEGQS